MKNNREIGTIYEELAVSYLRKKGYRILERNYQWKLGEIDVIAMDGHVLVFAEVKYRKNSEKGSALEAVDIRKQQMIVKTAFLYMANHPDYVDKACRFDVVAIDGEEITLLKGAFECE